MRVGIFGTGYAGLVTAVGLAEVGHTVTATDKDPDIAAAWTVVETMVHKDGVYFGAPHFKHKHQSLAALGYPEGTECWYCVINTKLLNKVVLCADTAPLAICRAALLWALKHGPQAPEGI